LTRGELRFYYLDSHEGAWNSGRDEKPNLGYKIRYKEGYFPTPPTDSLQDIRTEMMMTMIACGIPVEAQHHEVATGGSARSTCVIRRSSRWRQGAQVQVHRQERRQEARQDGDLHAKPIFQDNGSGMHVHASMWKNNVNLFAGSGYAGLSDMGLYAIGGSSTCARPVRVHQPDDQQLQAARAGYEAPVNLAYSRRNRSAAIRIPVYSPNPKAKRIEYRCPDGSSNPYLVFPRC